MLHVFSDKQPQWNALRVAARELLALANYWAQKQFAGGAQMWVFVPQNHQDCESLGTHNPG